MKKTIHPDNYGKAVLSFSLLIKLQDSDPDLWDSPQQEKLSNSAYRTIKIEFLEIQEPSSKKLWGFQQSKKTNIVIYNMFYSLLNLYALLFHHSMIFFFDRKENICFIIQLTWEFSESEC